MNYEVLEDWQTEAGYRAVVARMQAGHLCGYVALTEDHPLYGKGYGDAMPGLAEALGIGPDEPTGNRGIIPVFIAALDGNFDRPDVAFRVHGGITFADGGGKYPVEGDGLWWFGFDCNHSGDHPDVQNEEYVHQECEHFAEQLSKCSALGEA